MLESLPVSCQVSDGLWRIKADKHGFIIIQDLLKTALNVVSSEGFLKRKKSL